MSRCDLFCTTDPTNSTDTVCEWGRGVTASLPVLQAYPKIAEDIVLRNFYDKIYYYSFHIGDICFLSS